jgi:FkbM family methyltransferase
MSPPARKPASASRTSPAAAKLSATKSTRAAPAKKSAGQPRPAKKGVTGARFRLAALNDFPTRLPQQPFDVVFDVGANIGQSTLELAAAYPEAAIWAFEPIGSAFEELTTAVATLDRVKPQNLALGATASVQVMKSEGTAGANRIILGRELQPDHEEVRVVAGDEFCATHSIEYIDFLKVDAVGFDLEVIRGFHGLLGRGGIDVVQVEAGIYPNHPRQVPLERFRGYLEPLGFHLFGIYGQARGHRGAPVLSRIDAVFISQAAIERNTVRK